MSRGLINPIQVSKDIWRCLGCPTNSNSPAGSSALCACVCNTGFFGPSCQNDYCEAGKWYHQGYCQDCPSGMSKAFAGTELYLSCPWGKYTPYGHTTFCTDFANGKYSLTQLACWEPANRKLPLQFWIENIDNRPCTIRDGATQCSRGQSIIHNESTADRTCTKCIQGKYLNLDPVFQNNVGFSVP